MTDDRPRRTRRERELCELLRAAGEAHRVTHELCVRLAQDLAKERARSQWLRDRLRASRAEGAIQ